jgi:2-haloacid dehalogenase
MIITFDLYGTLVDWRYTIDSYLNFLNVNPNDFFQCEFEEIRNYKPYSKILKDCLRKVLGDKYNEDFGEGLIYAFAKSPLFPDVVIGLRMLGRIAKLGIISNTERKLVNITLSGIQEFFDWVITAEDTGYYKPNINAFIKAFEIMRVNPKEVIHVSSYPHYDLETASKIVRSTILLDRYGYSWSVKVNNLIELAKTISLVS